MGTRADIHPPPSTVSPLPRSAGLALAAYGARRAYLAGIDAGAAHAAPSTRNDDDDDDDDDDDGGKVAPDAPDARSSRRPVADADAAVPSRSPARDPRPGTPPTATPPPTTPPRDLAPPSDPSATPSPASSPPPFGAAYASTPPASTLPTSRPARRDLDRDIIPTSCATPSRTSKSATATTTTTTTSASASLDAVAAFDLDAVAESKRWFHFEAPPGVGVWPVPYTSRGCPKDAARAIVVTLDDAPAAAAAGAACAREVTRALGEADVACFAVSRGSYHVPVFHLSLPSEPISDPTAIPSRDGDGDVPGDGGVSRARSANPSVSLATAPLKAIGERFVPDHPREEALAASALRAAARAPRESPRDGDKTGDGSTVSTSSTLSLEVDRVAMSSDGALEMFFRDPDGSLAAARASLREVFPGAPSSSSSSFASFASPSIGRCVLLRAFPRTSTALAEGRNGRSLADAKAACARWTARLAGTRVAARRAWLVREERFESLDGPKRSLEL